VLEMESEKSKRYPSVGAITRMCLYLEVREDNFRTIWEDDAWEYFYELLSMTTDTLSREKLYDFFDGYLLPGEIDSHITRLDQLKRKTA